MGMARVISENGAKVLPRKRHESCIAYGVVSAETSRRTGKEPETMRKPPAKENIGCIAEKVELQMEVVLPRPSRKDKSTASLESIPMNAAQFSLQTLTHSMEATANLELATSAEDQLTQSRYAQRDCVVLEHLPLVRSIAVRVHDNLPVHVDLDDLIHAGIMGLFDAATKYDMEKNVAFSSYAKHRIKGAILDSLRQLDWASRDLRRRHKQVEAVTRDLLAELQRNPTEEEIAGKMGVEVDRWRQMMIDLRNVGLVSASTRTHENEDLPAPDYPTSADYHPDSICAREELKGMLAMALHTLPERYQRVVLLYYSNELTMKEIGSMLGINESRVSQIHKAALEKMANALGQAGIRSATAF
jgi:RNA polymerase sigma factor for flagellar operon FliA